MPQLTSNSLNSYNTFKVHAQAHQISTFSGEEDLISLLQSNKNQQPYLILGGGSNILFIDDFAGMVYLNTSKGLKVLKDTAEEVLIEVQSGEDWHNLVVTTLDKGWFGLENLALIPGTVGAAPIQNIGAYGVELADYVHLVKAIDLKTFEKRTFSRDECNFDYRDSYFKRKRGRYFINAVQFRLHKFSHRVHTSYEALRVYLEKKGLIDIQPKDVFDAVVAIRRSKLPDPKNLGNAGSFFKNPIVSASKFLEIQRMSKQVPHYPSEKGIKIPAAWLIHQIGFKGKRIGEVGTYEKQPLVVVNYGQATGIQIWDFAQKIQQEVMQKFGVELIPEVNIIKGDKILVW